MIKLEKYGRNCACRVASRLISHHTPVTGCNHMMQPLSCYINHLSSGWVRADHTRSVVWMSAPCCAATIEGRAAERQARASQSEQHYFRKEPPAGVKHSALGRVWLPWHKARRLTWPLLATAGISPLQTRSALMELQQADCQFHAWDCFMQLRVMWPIESRSQWEQLLSS